MRLAPVVGTTSAVPFWWASPGFELTRNNLVPGALSQAAVKRTMSICCCGLEEWQAGWANHLKLCWPDALGAGWFVLRRVWLTRFAAEILCGVSLRPTMQLSTAGRPVSYGQTAPFTPRELEGGRPVSYGQTASFTPRKLEGAGAQWFGVGSGGEPTARSVRAPRMLAKIL